MSRRALLAGVAIAGATDELRASDLELVMFERAGCPYCRLFDRTVAPLYDKTPEGKRAPLRRVSLDRSPLDTAATAGLSLRTPVVFSPTFVLLRGDREVGRITGFIDDGQFFGLLGRLLENHTEASP